MRLSRILVAEGLLIPAKVAGEMNQYGEIDRDSFPPGHTGREIVEVRIDEQYSRTVIAKLQLKMSDLKKLDDFLEEVYSFFSEDPNLDSPNNKKRLKSLEQKGSKFKLSMDHWIDDPNAGSAILVVDKFGNEWEFNVDGWQAQFDIQDIKKTAKMRLSRILRAEGLIPQRRSEVLNAGGRLTRKAMAEEEKAFIQEVMRDLKRWLSDNREDIEAWAEADGYNAYDPAEAMEGLGLEEQLRKFFRKGMTKFDALRMLKLMEEFDPRVPERYAIRKMKEIEKNYE